jgi:hypothetical protein
MTENDLDEFLELVGTEFKPDYHFYVVNTGLIEEIRIDDHSGNGPWPIVWTYKIINQRERADKLEWIRREIDKGRANKIVHKLSWRDRG